MTIRRKVLLGFGLILAMFAGLSVFVIDRIAVMSGHFHHMTESVIPTLGLTAEMSLTLDKLRVTEAYHVLEQNRDRMNMLVVAIEKLQARMYNLQADYRKLVTDPAQSDALDTLAADFKTYLLTFEKVRTISEGNQTEEAYRQLRRSAPIYAKLLTDITDLDDLTGDLAERAGSAGLLAIHDARNGTIGGVVLLAAVLMAMTAFTSRNILIPMRRLIGSINLLADGDLATDIPLTTRKDELGDVGRALEHFRANAIEKERLQKQERDDLEFARRIQLASVPRRFPAFPERPEIDICGRLAPTRAVGGDFFDFYLVDGTRLVFSIGDASGKGVASAMFAGMARSALKSEGVRSREPGLTLSDANRAIAADNESMMFMTTFFGVLDIESGELAYANAGHTPPYLMTGERVVETLPTSPGLPLGVAEEFEFMPRRRRLAPGDAVVLYTDGVTEAAAVDERLFGQQRLENLLAKHADEPSDQVVSAVFDSVLEFSEGTTQTDDIAILVMRYVGPPSTTPATTRAAAADSVAAD